MSEVQTYTKRRGEIVSLNDHSDYVHQLREKELVQVYDFKEFRYRFFEVDFFLNNDLKTGISMTEYESQIEEYNESVQNYSVYNDDVIPDIRYSDYIIHVRDLTGSAVIDPDDLIEYIKCVYNRCCG